MPTREMEFGLCIENRGAEDLDVRKVYRVLPDRTATATGYVRVIDESGEDYLYPTRFFVPVDVPSKAKRARGLGHHDRPSGAARRTGRSSGPGARVARSGR